MTDRVVPLRVQPSVVLAPMAGITDLPFRRLVARFGAVRVVSEMVASGEVVTPRASARSRARLELGLELGLAEGEGDGHGDGDGGGCVVQLAGRTPAAMAAAARLAEDMGARAIDINMGCPAKKVTGGLAGAALMRAPDEAARIVAAVVGAVSVPVSVKCRLGWDAGTPNAPGIAARAVAEGAVSVAVHGRTRAQFYTGRADWAAVAAVRAALPAWVPVIVNGDIDGVAAARAALAASGASGVMIGRAARGAPWLPAQIAAALAGRAGPAAPAGAALVELVAGHHAAMLGFYGRDLGQRVARKHLGWYLDRNAPGADAGLRRALLTAPTPEAVARLLDAAFAPGPDRGAGPRAGDMSIFAKVKGAGAARPAAGAAR